VTEGDEIMVNKIEGVGVQTKILLDKVLLIGTKYGLLLRHAIRPTCTYHTHNLRAGQ